MDTRNEPKACYKTRKKSNKWQAHDVRIPESKEWTNEFGWHSKNAKLFRTGYKIVHWKPFSDYEPNNSHYTTVAQMGWHLVKISMKCSILFGLSISITEWLCCCCSNSLVLVNLFGVLNQCVALVFSYFTQFSRFDAFPGTASWPVAGVWLLCFRMFLWFFLDFTQKR